MKPTQSFSLTCQKCFFKVSASIALVFVIQLPAVSLADNPKQYAKFCSSQCGFTDELPPPETDFPHPERRPKREFQAAIPSVEAPNRNNSGKTVADEVEIRVVVLNYVESFYNADTAKVYAAVHPELAKRGYFKRNGMFQETKMTFRQMVRLSAVWNKSNPIPADAPKEIVIFDIKEKIASAKVQAIWGTDYFHLVKQEGKWKIMHVLWQE